LDCVAGSCAPPALTTAVDGDGGAGPTDAERMVIYNERLAAAVEDALAKECARTSTLSRCLVRGNDDHAASDADGGALTMCTKACLDAIDSRNAAAAESAEQECEEKLVQAGGRGRFSCDLPVPPGKREDRETLKSLFGHELAAAFERARAGDQDAGAALDAMIARVLILDAQERASDCTKECNTAGQARVASEKEAARAATTGPKMVRNYKLCMVRLDSTREARRLAVYEKALFREYREKADATCREANNCDWLEGHSDLRCVYETPEWNEPPSEPTLRWRVK